MERNEFVDFLNTIFSQFGYKRKGNYWFSETETLRKVINLQKSNFGNNYYINYGWIIKELPLAGYCHYGSRINELLYVDQKINQEERQSELFTFIESYLLKKLETIDTEEELSYYLRSLQQPLKNMISGQLRSYFNIPFE